MHSHESMEATFFLNHISTMLTYKLYERLWLHKALDEYAASKLCDILWDVRGTTAGTQWQLESIPKSSRKAIVATGFQPPTDVG